METAMSIESVSSPESLGVGWIHELNVLSQQNYSVDKETWAESLLEAALAQGYSASLEQTGGGAGAPVLNVAGKSIVLGAMRYGEFHKYGLEAGKWIASQVTGTLYELSPEAKTLSRQEQLAALLSAMESCVTDDGRAELQGVIESVKAWWAEEDARCAQCASQQSTTSAETAAAALSSSVVQGSQECQGTEDPSGWLHSLNVVAESGYAEHVSQWAQSLVDAAVELGYEASLTYPSACNYGAPTLAVAGKEIVLGAIRYGEFVKYGLEPGPWIASQVNNTLYPLTSEARDLVRQEQLAALRAAMQSASVEDARNSVQGVIDDLLAFWVSQDAAV
jgi:hypothetical protein